MFFNRAAVVGGKSPSRQGGRDERSYLTETQDNITLDPNLLSTSRSSTSSSLNSFPQVEVTLDNQANVLSSTPTASEVVAWKDDEDHFHVKFTPRSELDDDEIQEIRETHPDIEPLAMEDEDEISDFLDLKADALDNFDEFFAAFEEVLFEIDKTTDSGKEVNESLAFYNLKIDKAGNYENSEARLPTEEELASFQKQPSLIDRLKKLTPTSITDIKNHPIYSLLAILTSAQPAISALMNESGKSPADLGAEWFYDMTPTQRALSIINMTCSFLVNYPVNQAFLMEAWPQVKENLRNTFKSPRDFLNTCYSMLLGGDSGIATGALTFDAFLFFLKIGGGYIVPTSVASFAAIISFASRLGGMQRAVKTIRNFMSSDVRQMLHGFSCISY